MEVLDFLKTLKNHSSGYGCDDGDGSGCGDGYGFNFDNGNGYSDGRGYSDGKGDGYGYGGNGRPYDNGDGYGCGADGDKEGNGYGYSYSGVKSINKNDVYLIDGVETILIKVKNNVAKGFILKKDLSQIPCYVVKNRYLFAHGKNLKDAKKALLEKIFKNLSEDERIDAFLDNFKLNIKYPVVEFYEWHNKLTGSCELGRQTFCPNHNIDLKNDKLTVNEFIDLCINNYGGEVIQLLKNKIEEN